MDMLASHAVRPSAFLCEVSCDDGVLVFNTLTRGIVHTLSGLPSSEHLTPEQNWLLQEHGFLVPRQLNENEELKQALSIYDQHSDMLYVILTVATNCDLTCDYCFENRMARAPMSRETLDQALVWIDAQLASGRYRSFYMILFGGEPMLKPDTVETALKETKKICDRHGVTCLPALLTTNALLGDDAQYERLRNLGVGYVQITFDGDRSMTNSRRKSRNMRDKDVYGETLARLPFMSQTFNLALKLNFAPDTVHSIARLFDDLLERKGIDLSRVTIKPETIAITKPSNGVFEDSVFTPDTEALAKAFSLIFQEAEIRGLSTDSSAVFNTPCMAFTCSSALIEPNGNIRSCISAFGMDEFKTGDVFGNRQDHSLSTTVERVAELSDCIDHKCAFLPMCAGGCPYEKVLTTQNAKGVLCRINYFENILPVYVRQNWLKARHKLYLT